MRRIQKKKSELLHFTFFPSGSKATLLLLVHLPTGGSDQLGSQLKTHNDLHWVGLSSAVSTADWATNVDVIIFAAIHDQGRCITVRRFPVLNFNCKETTRPDHRLSESNIYILRGGKRKGKRDNNWNETKSVSQRWTGELHPPGFQSAPCLSAPSSMHRHWKILKPCSGVVYKSQRQKWKQQDIKAGQTQKL